MEQNNNTQPTPPTDEIATQDTNVVVNIQQGAQDVVVEQQVEQSENVAQQQTPPTAEELKRKKRNKFLINLAIYLVIAGTILFTAINDFSSETVDVGAIFASIGNNWHFLFVLLGLYFGTVLFETLKLYLMMRKTTRKYMFGKAFTCAVIGRYYDFVTPFSTGGQPFQMYYLGKHGVDVGSAGAIPIGSFFLNQITFFILTITSFISGVSTDAIPLALQIIAYVGCFFTIAVPFFLVVFSFMPKAGHKVITFGVKLLTKLRICKNPQMWIDKGNNAIDNNRKNMGILFKSKRVLIFCVLFAFLYNICMCSMPYFTLLLFQDIAQPNGILSATLSWDMWFEFTKITFYIYCIITFVPTPGNSGAADGTFYGLFKSMLVVGGTCFAAMMIWRIFSFYIYILMGVIVSAAIGITDQYREKHPLGKI